MGISAPKKKKLAPPPPPRRTHPPNLCAPVLYSQKEKPPSPFSPRTPPPTPRPPKEEKIKNIRNVRKVVKAEMFLQLFLKCGNFQRKCENAIFSRTVFANEKTHMGPTLNTCKVGAWRAALKNFHSSLFSAQRLVHVCRATTNVQNRFVHFFLLFFLRFCSP